MSDSEDSAGGEESEAEVSDEYGDSDEAQLDDIPQSKARAKAAPKPRATQAKSSAATVKKRSTKRAAEVNIAPDDDSASDAGISQSQAGKRQFPWSRR